jgi:tRNA nucleotidyltransferase (CCA-adding enzyme)
MHEPGWEHFPHEADIGVRGFGPTLASAFEEAATAMTAVIADPRTIRPLQHLEVTADAPNHELLLVDWLNRLVYEMAVRKMLFSRFKVEMDGHHLHADIWGEGVDVDRHKPAIEVKGATYTELKVKHDENGMWLAQCVVDV